MKSNVMFALLLTALTWGGAQAQTQPAPTGQADQSPMEGRRGRMANVSPEERAQRQTTRMKKQLDLTVDQETKVAAINLNYAQQLQAMMANGDRKRGMMKQGQEMMSNRNGELKNVLSADQYSRYETMQKEQVDRMRQNRGQRRR